MYLYRNIQAIVLSLALATSGFSAQAPQTAPQPSTPTPQDLQQLVAPIALYPDALLAQVLAAATYPTQVVEADRWIQQNAGLKGDKLAKEVDKYPWDVSVKGLTQFPSVLRNMSQNLSWTSALGDAYFNEPNGVTAAIQTLRKDASAAGNLQSTPEQKVTTEGQTIVIQPAQQDVVYVPQYSPAVVYGTPIAAYPDYSGWDVVGASMVSFGVGMAVGAAFGGWGWGHWGYNWGGGSATFNRNAYVSRSNTFVNRNSAYRNGNRANYTNRNGAGRSNGAYGNRFTGSTNRGTGNRPRTANSRERQNSRTSRGYGSSGAGNRRGAFGGARQGGSARRDSSRGNSSFSGRSGRSGGGRRSGGGGRSRGGGGRSRGGGGRSRGGGRR